MVCKCLHSSSPEDIRNLISKGDWLCQYIDSSGVKLLDGHLSGAVIPNDSSYSEGFHLRFSHSVNKDEGSRINRVWRKLNLIGNSFSRQVYIRELIFKGYVLENIFAKEFYELRQSLFVNGNGGVFENKPVSDIEPQSVQSSNANVMADAKTKLGKLM